MSEDLSSLFANIHTESGKTLLTLTEQSPVLLVFLRHFGCAFCRQAISDISDLREELARRNVRPVFVHLGSPERAKPFFDYYHLSDVERISNPDGELYRTAPFDLGRQHPIMQLFTPKVVWAWLAGAIKKHGIGAIREDGHQMPGIFFMKDGKVIRSFRYKTVADQPNYRKLIA